MGSRVTLLSAVITATLAGGGGAAATWGDRVPDGNVSVETALETPTFPVMDVPNGCAGDDWSVEDSID